MATDSNLPMGRGATLVDVLDRILDKGLVVAGDVKISLADVELLTIRIRLIICSVDKAESIGMDWWRADPYFSSLASAREPNALSGRPAAALGPGDEARRLTSRLDDLDRKLSLLLEEKSRSSAKNDPK